MAIINCQSSEIPVGRPVIILELKTYINNVHILIISAKFMFSISYSELSGKFNNYSLPKGISVPYEEICKGFCCKGCLIALQEILEE